MIGLCESLTVKN